MGVFGFLKRKQIKPQALENTTEHYLPVPDYANQPIPLSVWRLGKKRPPQDFWGNTGRIYSQQVLTSQGPLLFATQLAIEAGLGGNSGMVFGQGYTLPVAGFAGRPAQITPYSTAAEYNQVNYSASPGKIPPSEGGI